MGEIQAARGRRPDLPVIAGGTGFLYQGVDRRSCSPIPDSFPTRMRKPRTRALHAEQGGAAMRARARRARRSRDGGRRSFRKATGNVWCGPGPSCEATGRSALRLAAGGARDPAAEEGYRFHTVLLEPPREQLCMRPCDAALRRRCSRPWRARRGARRFDALGLDPGLAHRCGPWACRRTAAVCLAGEIAARRKRRQRRKQATRNFAKRQMTLGSGIRCSPRRNHRRAIFGKYFA